MDNQSWDELWSKKAEIDRALVEKKILLSEWFSAVDPILHLLSPALNDVPHRLTAADIREMERQAPAPRRSAQPNILVVRRFPYAQEHARAILQHEGYAVTTAGDGMEALVELVLGGYDLVVTGSVLPHLSGVELIELKDRLRIDTPAIMHTLMPLELASGLALRIPLSREDCICAGSMASGSPRFNLKDLLELDGRMVVRVKEHLRRRGMAAPA